MIILAYLYFGIAAFNAAVSFYIFTNGNSPHINVAIAVFTFGFALIELCEKICKEINK